MSIFNELQYATPVEWLLLLSGAGFCCALPVVILVAILGALRD